MNCGRARSGSHAAGVWRVERLYEGSDGITYAQITDPVDGSVKTISQGTLLDRNFYLPAD